MGMLVFRSECYLCASVAGPRPNFSYTGPEAFQVTGNDTISKSRVLLVARVALHACLPACLPAIHQLLPRHLVGFFRISLKELMQLEQPGMH